jgi:hypothetical protein
MYRAFPFSKVSLAYVLLYDCFHGLEIGCRLWDGWERPGQIFFSLLKKIKIVQHETDSITLFITVAETCYSSITLRH